jgi:cell division protein FtsI/penicillin-binding protein 2
MRQSRFSMEAMLDAPDTSSSRPGLRLRIAGLVVAGLFALLGLRLWALTVLQAPAAAQAISVNQIRNVPVEPTRGLILDRSGNPLVGNVVVQQITLSRSAAQEHPEVIGRLATLIGETPQQVEATIADPRNSLYKPVPVLTGGSTAAEQNQILSDILYISEHQADFPGVAAVRAPRAGVRRLPGLPGPRVRGDHQQRRAGLPQGPGLPGR